MRRGASLLEAVVALTCGLLVVQLSLSGLASVRTVEQGMIRRSERLAALRVARVVLRRELRFGVWGADWVDFPRDSVELRAFRGVALVCSDGGRSADLLVAWSGARDPAPEKDSVLLLTERGSWLAADLLTSGSTRDRCRADPSMRLKSWRLSVTPDEPVVLARLFERGSYHISGKALRYRRGGAGRQPLTPEVLDTPPSGFVRSAGSLGLEWMRARDGQVWHWVGFLAGGGP